MRILQQEELSNIAAGFMQEQCSSISIFSKIDPKNATQILCKLHARNTLENIMTPIIYASATILLLAMFCDVNNIE